MAADDRSTFGDLLRTKRKDAGLGQFELATRAKISTAAIRAYEHHRHLPQRANLKALIDALELSDQDAIQLHRAVITDRKRAWALRVQDTNVVTTRDPSKDDLSTHLLGMPAPVQIHADTDEAPGVDKWLDLEAEVLSDDLTSGIDPADWRSLADRESPREFQAWTTARAARRLAQRESVSGFSAPLILAHDIDPRRCKLGDDEAALFPFQTEPIREAYDAAMSAVLDAANRSGPKSGILIMGEANSGKTRLALHILMRTLPDWLVLRWDPAYTTMHIPPAATLKGQRVAIMIDDLHDYAAPNPTRARAWAIDALSMIDRAASLRAMRDIVYQEAAQVITFATCRSEEHSSSEAQFGRLFEELSVVDLPQLGRYPSDLQAAIVETFKRLGARHTVEWDGTLGSLVLGLSRKRAEYKELLQRGDLSVCILHAMKLLQETGTSTHTYRRLREICAQVFGERRLRDEEGVWRVAVEDLLRLQFVTITVSPTSHPTAAGNDEPSLLIRNDTYFDHVIVDYPRPSQLDADLLRLEDVYVSLEDAAALLALADSILRRGPTKTALRSYRRLLEVDQDHCQAWHGIGVSLEEMGRLGDALAAYERALEIEPDDPHLWDHQGDMLSKLGRHEEALAAYEQAVGRDETYLQSVAIELWILDRNLEALATVEKALLLDIEDTGLYRLRGRLLFDLGRYDDAVTAYDRAISLDTSNAAIWCEKGDALRYLGRYENASAAYDKSLRLDGTSTTAWEGKGRALLGGKRLTDALAALERAAALNPHDIEVQKLIRYTLHELGRYAEMSLVADGFLALHPENTEAWCDKADALRHLERFEEALKAWDEALALKPTDARALASKGSVFLVLGQYELSLACCDVATRIAPEFARVWCDKGAALWCLERYDEALKALDESLERDPDYIRAWDIKTKIFHTRGQYEPMLACTEEAIRTDPAYVQAWRDKVDALWHLGRFEEVVAESSRAIALSPNDSVVWKLLGYSLSALERHDQALEAFTQALAFDPHDAHLWQRKGITLGRLKRYDEALEACGKALTLNPHDAGIWESKGIRLYYVGRYDDALEAFDRALAIAPNQQSAWTNRGTTLSRIGRTEEALASYDRGYSWRDADADEFDDSDFVGLIHALRKEGREAEALEAEARAQALGH